MSVVYRFAEREQHLGNNAKREKHLFNRLPWFIWTVSAVQVILFSLGQQDVYQLLLYSHQHSTDLWRYASYMLLHSDVIHLILNITIQCLIATPLEYEQSTIRTGLVYIIGGLAGSVGTSILDPDLSMVGSSAGVYALLTSHIPHIVLNYKSLKYKSYRILSVLSLCIGDITYNALHPSLANEPVISWPAHLSGALAGLLAGFVIYSTQDKEDLNTLIIFIRWLALVLILTLVVCLLFIRPVQS